MSERWLVCFVFLAVGNTAMSEEDRPTVRVAQGLVKGQRVDSEAGGSFFSFRGLPFAKPPIGPLRFKDAEPPEAWEGVREADTEGSSCSQLDVFTRQYLGTEDCLYLNVYTPRLPPAGLALPVMVHIHGGGFISGSGTEQLYGADYLVADDVVMVNINYRLGVLGFLFLNDPAAPGNAGLKDQVAALRWVQQNIAAFGGDPGNVTIFGASAGAASAHFHMLSPLSKGLFHGAIAQSGAIVNPWVEQYKPVETARRLARALGCSSEDPEEIVNFLRGIDHMKLVRSASEDAALPRDRDRYLGYSFVPTPELAVPGVETFLPAPAEQLMEEGKHHAVPYLTGAASHEAYVLFFFRDLRNPEVAAQFDGNWEGTVLPEVRIPSDSPRAAEALKELRQHFMGGRPLGEDNMAGFIDMFSDLTFTGGVDYTVRLMARANKAPIYYYTFDLDTELNFLKLLMQLQYPGASHGDDLGYLFRNVALNANLTEESTAAVGRRRMCRLWTNFAKTGNPTPAEDPLLGARWPAYSERGRAYLEIGAQLRPGADLNPERAQFWHSFYQKYGAQAGH